MHPKSKTVPVLVPVTGEMVVRWARKRDCDGRLQTLKGKTMSKVLIETLFTSSLQPYLLKVNFQYSDARRETRLLTFLPFLCPKLFWTPRHVELFTFSRQWMLSTLFFINLFWGPCYLFWGLFRCVKTKSTDPYQTNTSKQTYILTNLHAKIYLKQTQKPNDHIISYWTMYNFYI